MHDINELNTRFGLAEKLSFSTIGENMAMAVVSTEQCSARIALQGAQVVDWTPVGAKPVIWLSRDAKFLPGKSIRGGVPVCWPWFGAHESRKDVPAHGHARTVPWDVLSSKSLEDGRIKLTFCLQTSPATQALWPHDTPLELHISLGTTLELELITRNNDSEPVIISEALHTYFAVGDIRQVGVIGLDSSSYLDKVDEFTRKTQRGNVTFTGEVDRVYVNTESECIINDSVWQRRIHIKKEGSRSTVVWNPWIDKAAAMGDLGEAGYMAMLCVESGNALDNLVTIEPGEEHRLRVIYNIE